MRIILIYNINKGASMTNLNLAPINSINTKVSARPDKNTTIYSNTLFAYGDVVLIQHQEDQYYLRRTRNGKLILTK